RASVLASPLLCHTPVGSCARPLLSGGGTMTNYYPLLSSMIASLGNKSPEARRRLYECARGALLGLLHSELELARERGALEMAILRIEEEAARKWATAA